MAEAIEPQYKEGKSVRNAVPKFPVVAFGGAELDGLTASGDRGVGVRSLMKRYAVLRRSV